MPNVSVVFSAETGQFVSNVDGMDKSIAKASEQVAKAKNTILQWGQSSVEAAKEAGASSERLASIQERTAQRLASVTEQNATRVVNALDRQAAKAREVAAEMQTLNRVIDISTAKSNSFRDVPNRLQTSTVLRVTEGSTSIRGAEAFISAVPVLSKLSNFVFPVAAAAGFVAIVGEGVAKLKEMYDKAQQVPSAIADGLAAINRPLMQGVDSLQQDNDQLQATIDKLEHKPGDALALAIDDARKRTDALANSAREASDAITKLLKDQQVGAVGELLGKGGTSDITKEVKGRFDAITAAQNDDRKQFRYADTMARALTDPKARDAAEKAAQDTQTTRQAAIAKRLSSLQDYIRMTRQTINGTTQAEDYVDPKSGVIVRGGTVSYAKRFGDQSANNNLLNGAEDIADSMQLQRVGMATNVRLTGTAKALQGDKTLTESTNKAKAAQLKALENYVNVWKTMAPVSQKAIFDFWQGQLSAFQGSPEQLDAINAKLGTLATEGANKAHEAFKKLKDEQAKIDERKPEALTPLDFHYGNAKDSSQQLNVANAKAALTYSQLQAEVSKTRVQIDLANGSIDKSTAEHKLAAIAAQEHKAKLAELNEELTQFKSNAWSWNPAKQRYGNDREQQQYIGLQADIAKETASQTVDAMKDAAQQSADTWQSALNTSFDLWLQHATDTAGQVKELFTQTVDGLNENLVNLMSGDYHHNDFKKYGHNLFKTGAGDLLKQSESHLVSAFTKKADGSSASPFHVIVESIRAGISGAEHLFGEGTSSSSGGGGGKSGGGIFGSIASLFHPRNVNGAAGNGTGDDAGSSGGARYGAKPSWTQTFLGYLGQALGVAGAFKGGGGTPTFTASGPGGGTSGLDADGTGIDSSIFGGGRAIGGDVSVGHIYQINENGQELFAPSVNGRMIPHGQSSSTGGGNVYYTVHVADGVTPAQMSMHLRDALQQFHPHVVQASVQAVKDDKRRSGAR